MLKHYARAIVSQLHRTLKCLTEQNGAIKVHCSFTALMPSITKKLLLITLYVNKHILTAI